MDLPTIERVAARYRAEGYEVVVHPRGDDLPPFAGGCRDRLDRAEAGRDVIVEVQPDPAAASRTVGVEQLAEVANAQPGWRFDLAWEPESPLQRGIEEVGEPSDEQLAAILDEAERLADEGQSPYACVVAWAGA